MTPDPSQTEGATVSASAMMQPKWTGKKYRIYRAGRTGFVKPGYHLWTGKRHLWVLPTVWPSKERRAAS